MAAAAFILVMDVKGELREIRDQMREDHAWVVTTREFFLKKGITSEEDSDAEAKQD